MKPSLTRRVVYGLSRAETWHSFGAVLIGLGGALLAVVGGIVYWPELEAMLTNVSDGAIIVGAGMLAFAICPPLAYVIILAKDIQELRDELAVALAALKRQAGPSDGSDVATPNEGDASKTE